MLVYNVKLSDADVQRVEDFMIGDRSCAAGEAFSFSTLGCLPCAKGLYKNSSGALPCTPCPVGSTTAREGSLSIASCSLCPVSNPESPCTGVFQIGSSQVPMLYMTEGSSAWVAVKYTTDTANAIVENTWNAANRNYYISQSTLRDCIENATDILMVESTSSVYANMSNAAAFLKVRNNIQIGCAWFKGTHSQNTLVGWMSPYATAKEIPDARLGACDGYMLHCYNCLSPCWMFVFDSCGNGDGSHSRLNQHLRLRDGHYSVARSHSIWFRIPLTLRLSALPPFSVPVSQGLIAMYSADSWRPADSVSKASWLDLSGSGNHVTEIGGTTISVARPVGAPAYIYGAPTAWMQFPAGILPSAQYTLFFVARYNGAAKQRIFQGLTINWLSGFHNIDSLKIGVAFHGSCGWITPATSDSSDNWVVGSDRSNSFRSNGKERGGISACAAFDRLAINKGPSFAPGEESDFAIQSMLVYNVKLSDADVQRVEAWLTAQQPAFTPANMQVRSRADAT
jgi:hypothetical protein